VEELIAFPGWTLRTSDLIAPDERLPWTQTAALGVQHVFAMFGATVLAPVLMGFDPNVAILCSGVGTLIFFAVVGGKAPSYLGSSFAYIAVVIAATGYTGPGPNPNIAVALGGIGTATLAAIVLDQLLAEREPGTWGGNGGTASIRGAELLVRWAAPPQTPARPRDCRRGRPGPAPRAPRLLSCVLARNYRLTCSTG
jgi:xanthine/uracil permease